MGHSRSHRRRLCRSAGTHPRELGVECAGELPHCGDDLVADVHLPISVVVVAHLAGRYAALLEFPRPPDVAHQRGVDPALRPARGYRREAAAFAGTERYAL